MIKRFEDEFPETRLPSLVTSPPLPDLAGSPSSLTDQDPILESRASDTEQNYGDPALTDDEEGSRIHPVLSRHNSDVSIASRALAQEEGRMHRFGQKVRRDILKPQGEEPDNNLPNQEHQVAEEPRHLQMLRSMMEGLEGEEIKERIAKHGEEKIMMELNSDASQFRQMLIDSDPEGFESFRLSMEAAQKNNEQGLSSTSGGGNTKAVESVGESAVSD